MYETAFDLPTCLAPLSNKGFRLSLDAHSNRYLSISLSQYIHKVLKFNAQRYKTGIIQTNKSTENEKIQRNNSESITYSIETAITLLTSDLKLDAKEVFRLPLVLPKCKVVPLSGTISPTKRFQKFHLAGQKVPIGGKG